MICIVVETCTNQIVDHVREETKFNWFDVGGLLMTLSATLLHGIILHHRNGKEARRHQRAWFFVFFLPLYRKYLLFTYLLSLFFVLDVTRGSVGNSVQIKWTLPPSYIFREGEGTYFGIVSEGGQRSLYLNRKFTCPFWKKQLLELEESVSDHDAENSESVDTLEAKDTATL